MSAPSFCHLRLHSEFSVQDGLLRIEDVIALAQADGQPAVALTDLSNLFGLIKFYTAARKAGVKPIVGCEIGIDTGVADRPARMVLLVQDHAGYLRLSELLTRAYRENQPRGLPLLRPEWLDAVDGNPGLIALSGAQWGGIGQAILNGNAEQAESLARAWSQRFPGRFYLEIQRNGRPESEPALRGALALASRLDLPVVATHPVQFKTRDDFKAHETRVCIAHGEILADRRRPQRFVEDDAFLTQAEMGERFADLPEALANSVEIARRCNLTLVLGKSYLPNFPTPPGVGLEDFLREQARTGLTARMLRLYPEATQREARQAEYDARLELELATIIQMGFPGYFLIVADFINWGKQNGVPVGPGRGSGAGSLVAYALGITDLDPLRYALLFERFLNPERVSMPDFDIDFCQDQRYRVIEYVRAKYGEDAVSQIVTFGTMAARAVLRDVGRALELPYNFCDQLSKMIPNAPGKMVSLDEALAQVPELKERYDKEEEVRELFELARRLEGLTRNVGMHAGGVLIAPGKLTDFCPLYLADGAGAVAVSQFDKDDVEKAGLVKFDFLGLRNLTIIDLAVKYCRRLDPAFDTDIETLSFDDPAAYAILKKANTTAIFQLESEGMKKLLAKLAPDCFEDIIAVLALYRPGPLGSGMVDDFVLRKKGKQTINYFHPDLKECLSPTYGVIVYQEQVMQISQIIGGYTLGGADLLRRAMGKKKVEEMAEHREIFRAGALKKGYDEKLAMQLFDLMEKFAEYGFNKSHTAAYAVISYQTAWLKAHHTAAFLAATLSADMDNTDSVQIFYEDGRANGMTLLAPDINASVYRFVPVSRSEVRYGLGAVKGTGENAVNHLVQEREANGPFVSLFDFCRRVDKRVVNRRAMEALVRAGAFDGLHENRAMTLASVGLAMEWADVRQQTAQQDSLFGEATANEPPPLVEVPAWGVSEQLVQEKIALGYYFSGHPFSSWRADLVGLVDRPLGQVVAQKEPVLLAGIIAAVRTQMTRRGKMAFALLEDGHARLEVAIFSEVFDANREQIKEDRLLIIRGKAVHDEYSGGLRVTADEVFDLPGLRTRHAVALRLVLEGQAQLGALRGLLQPFCRPGEGTPVSIDYRNGAAQCRLRLGDGWRVWLAEDLLEGLRSTWGRASVQIEYPSVRRA
ncbi:MAG: DNA polymerase III subunit alpha [Betaproteobacteria bacterium]|nr:MAG: DNA polymerase III subunit alpha [Betaproteobacteria bacterium]